MANTILSVRDLRVNFSLRGKTLTAVRGASLDLYENETLAIVGESGSGKSVLTKTLIGMTDKNRVYRTRKNVTAVMRENTHHS